MKKLIRLTEGDLHKIVKESVNRMLRESTNPRRSFGKKTRINESNVDNESILQCLKELSENETFVELLKWGVIKLRAEHYEDADIGRMSGQKDFDSIEDAADFVNSSREQTYIYVDGWKECLNIYDLL